MAGPPTRTQVEFLLPRRTPERAQADRPHDITGSLLCPQHSSSTGRRAPTRAPRAQGTGSGQRVPGKTARGCRRARGLAERATPSRLRGAGDSKGADDSSDPTRKSGQRGRLGRPAAAPARSLEMMYPGAQNGLREPLCCECHVHFGGRLPVPRAEAALPYWVPSSLRPREQSQRTVRFHVPKASESCPCLCHCVRGRLPVPRSQAMMPYWVPQVLRSPKKTVKRQRSFRGLQERPLDSRAHYNCWRVCCDRRLLLKWQQLQAVGQDEPPAPGRTASSLDSLLTLLQTVLRAIGAIRTRLWLSSKIALLSEEDQC
ncbi:uncharacterized protein C16orf95 homolog isoform X3 [Oryctolagus cuniculus]|uniref:uncharacterized protein C16orf95 homolog isoform X3 n=1 Tax=Oryctolagus cuniculus TaxID=9986 RepID=UPI00387A79D7